MNIEMMGLTNKYTSLYPDVQHNNPDDMLSIVPYVKGF